MKRIAAVSAVIAVLSACESAPEQPKLVDGQLNNISGIGYSTDTQSGVTTRDGSFQYIEGETVTFTLGDQVIGRAVGASELSLFDILDGLHSLPRDAKTLRQQLRSYQPTRVEKFPSARLNRAYTGGSPSGIHWAANVSRILLALDADKNLSNGVDTASNDWSTKLADYALDFNMPLDEFADDLNNLQLKRLSHDHALPTNFRLAEPLEQLYATAEIAIAGKVRLTSARENLTTHYAWTDNGLIAQKVYEYNTSDTTFDYTYNADGTLKTETYTRDSGKDGSFDDRREETFSYNDYGKPEESSYERFANNDNSNPTETRTYAWSYVDGKVFLSTYLRGINSSSYDGTHYQYNDDFKVTYAITPGYNSSGEVTVEAVSQYVYTYDEQGRLTASERQSDFDGDGVPATIAFGEDYSYVGNTVSFETRSRNFFYYDYDYSYDDTGSLREFVQYSHNDGAGPSRGLGDPNLRSTLTATMHYDDEGLFDVCEQITRDTDGNILYYNYYDHEWGENGIVASEYRDGNDPEALTVDPSIALVYGDEGEWASATLWGSDEYSYTYTTLDNALAHIVLEVLDIEEDEFDTEFGSCGG